MGKIFCLMGKSASGKDTIYQKLLENKGLGLMPIIPYTTRPMRTGERQGVDYHFCTNEQADLIEKAGMVVEMRAYNTKNGVWRYFTVDNGKYDLKKHSYLVIGTPVMYKKLVGYFKQVNVCPIYITVDDGIRLSRALNREQMQTHPNYEEMCRRFLADQEDFAEGTLLSVCGGIPPECRFENREASWAAEEIAEFIRVCSIA